MSPSSRSRILDSAVRLFQEHGVSGTSLADVIEHSAAPRGSLYHYFPGGKSQLAAEATERAAGVMRDLLQAALTYGDPTAAIGMFVDYWSGVLVESDFTAGCPVVAAALGHKESAPARDAAGAAFAAWHDVLSTGLLDAGIPRDRVHTLATTAIAAVEGAIVLARAQRSLEPLREVGAHLTWTVRTVLAAAAAPDRQRGPDGS